MLVDFLWRCATIPLRNSYVRLSCWKWIILLSRTLVVSWHSCQKLEGCLVFLVFVPIHLIISTDTSTAIQNRREWISSEYRACGHEDYQQCIQDPCLQSRSLQHATIILLLHPGSVSEESFICFSREGTSQGTQAPI